MTNNTDPVRERDMLAQAIRDAAVKRGIVRADADLAGPHLLMLCEDLASAPPSAPVGVLSAIAGQLRLAGAALPAPKVQGTPESGVITGLSIALALVESALAQQPAAPSGEEVAILHPQPRKLGAYGSYYDPPRTHRAFTYAHQPGNLLASRLGDAFRKAAAGSAGDGIDQGLGLLRALQEAGFGVFQIDPNYTAPQQPAAVDTEALREVAHQMRTRYAGPMRGSAAGVIADHAGDVAHMHVRWADRIDAAIAAQQQGGA